MRKIIRLLALFKRLDTLLGEKTDIFFEERPYLENKEIIASQLFSPLFQDIFIPSLRREENEEAIKKTLEEINK